MNYFWYVYVTIYFATFFIRILVAFISLMPQKKKFFMHEVT